MTLLTFQEVSSEEGVADLLIDGMCDRGVHSGLGPVCSEGGKREDDIGLVEVVCIPECLCVCCVRGGREGEWEGGGETLSYHRGSKCEEPTHCHMIILISPTHLSVSTRQLEIPLSSGGFASFIIC